MSRKGFVSTGGMKNRQNINVAPRYKVVCQLDQYRSLKVTQQCYSQKSESTLAENSVYETILDINPTEVSTQKRQ